MRKNKILEKLLAIILIFTLTFVKFAFVTESLAISISETLFGTENSTGHKNVEFEAYFGTEAEKETSVIASVNDQDISISISLNVQNDGYLKDGKIQKIDTRRLYSIIPGEEATTFVSSYISEIDKIEFSINELELY